MIEGADGSPTPKAPSSRITSRPEASDTMVAVAVAILRPILTTSTVTVWGPGSPGER